MTITLSEFFCPSNEEALEKALKSAHLIVYNQEKDTIFAITYCQDTDQQPYFTAVVQKSPLYASSFISQANTEIAHQDDLLIEQFIDANIVCRDELPRHLFSSVAKYLGPIYKSQKKKELESTDFPPIVTLGSEENQDALCRHWILLLLIDAQASKPFLKTPNTSNIPLSQFLGIITSDSNYDAAALGEQLAEQRAQSLLPIPLPTQWLTSLYALAHIYQLSDASVSIMIFCYLCNQHKHLKYTLSLLPDMSVAQHIKLLASLLAFDETDIHSAISHDSPLVALDLLQIELSNIQSVGNRLSLKSTTNYDQWRKNTFDAYQWFGNIQTQIKPINPLPLSAYPYWQKAIEQIHSLLQKPTWGVNILISAKSGMGKTALIHSIINEYALTAYHINAIDLEGRTIGHLEQLKYYHQLQRLPNKIPNACYVFDNQYAFWQKDGLLSTSYVDSYVDMLSTLLTNNMIPCFWLVEDAGSMDTMLLNKFTTIIQLSELHHQDKYVLVDQCTQHLLNPIWIERIAQHHYITPAMVIPDAFSLAQLKKTPITEQQSPRQLHYLQQINQRLRLAKSPALTLSWKQQDYDLRYLNTDMDLTSIVQQLMNSPQIRLCLYGPSGTGKTGFAKYLAQQLNVPLHIKKASDLLGAYIGDSEKAIANAFLQAEQQQAVLLIDEIDGLIAKREHSHYQWQVTQINEILVQLENFSGIFIATTNHLESFDSAALRRFDLKIKTDYLTSEQAIMMLEAEICDLALNPLTVEQRHQIAHMMQLTPSDFMLLRRQHHFLPIHTTEILLTRLDSLLAFKEDGKKIGFV